MFNVLFGKKKSTVDPVKAIAALKESLCIQEKREIYSQKRINENKDEAKIALKADNKQKAVSLLKRNKRLEKELETSSGMRDNIEMQIFALEQSVNSISMINAMKMGKAALDTTVKNLNPDSVDDLMAELQETVSAANEVSDLMSRPIGTEYEDDDDLLAELMTSPRAESVAAEPVAAEHVEAEPCQSNEDKELEELQASMLVPA
jgi:charged multivesicular body protein 4